MLRKKHYLAVGAVTLVTVLVLSLPSGAVSHLKLAIGGLFLPLFGSVSAVRQLPGRAANNLLPRAELLKEIETLQRENDQLKLQNSQAGAISRETTSSARKSAGSASNRGSSSPPASFSATRPIGGAPSRLTSAGATAWQPTCRC